MTTSDGNDGLPMAPNRAPTAALIPARLQPLIAAAAAACLLSAVAWLAASGGFSGGLADHDAPPTASPQFTLDINEADAIEIAQLPGLGPATAERIVDHRTSQGRFRSVESLLDVPGIGDATLARIRPHLRPIVSPPARP
jgi:competence ComEA-like helix-hairpin-helix protein